MSQVLDGTALPDYLNNHFLQQFKNKAYLAQQRLTTLQGLS